MTAIQPAKGTSITKEYRGFLITVTDRSHYGNRPRISKIVDPNGKVVARDEIYTNEILSSSYTIKNLVDCWLAQDEAGKALYLEMVEAREAYYEELTKDICY